MMMAIFAVYDVKAEMYGRPFFESNKFQALRAFTDVVNNLESQIGKYPAEFKLVQLGTFDDVSGVVSPLVEPLSLGFGSEFIRRPNGNGNA